MSILYLHTVQFNGLARDFALFDIIDLWMQTESYKFIVLKMYHKIQNR